MFKEKSPQENTEAPKTVSTNWPFIIGLTLVAFIALVAVFGPSLAPNDPREHKLIIRIDDTWLTPPYPAFTPGYPLGSDNLGRDLYSWLLWSVRPTMLMVIVVAGLRMALGLMIGVGAGWSDGWLGRMCDLSIAAALSVPALLASLIVITAVGFHLGVWSFVVGLAVTGWAETAQLVRERTRTIKAQQAVEAARALGASGGQMFFLHILPQVMPMIWMLLAFEISNTLVTTAGLGFLGYYLGGAVFTEVDDFVYQRIAEMPELGQMLATAWMVLDEPWAMVAAGTVVFLIVLAFNLVGEGLQRRLTRKLGGTRGLYTLMARDILPWFEEHIGEPLAALFRWRAFRPALALLAVVIIGGGVVWWRGQQDVVATDIPVAEATKTATAAMGTDATGEESAAALPRSALTVPGGHIYANQGHDPWRTYWVDFSGPVTDTVRWTFESTGFTGGPVIAADGTLYLNDKDGTIYALDGDAKVQWQATVPAQPVGAGALAADGTLYVADKEGLSALSPAGETLWRFTPDDGEAAVDGPVVGLDGTVYYKSLSGLWAVNAAGTLRWRAPITETAEALVPHLGPKGDVVFWKDVAFKTADGSPYVWEDVLLTRNLSPRTVVGADGQLYHHYHELLLHVVPADTALSDAIAFDWSIDNAFFSEGPAGVTPDGYPWMTARIAFGQSFNWGNLEGGFSSTLKLITSRNLHIAGVDPHHIAYLCRDSYESVSACYSVTPDSDQAQLRVNLQGVKAIAGVALAPGRLYVATWDGKLFAIGEAEARLPDVTPGGGPDTIEAALPVPGQHIWAMERHDPWGTLWSGARGPTQPDVAWTFEADGALAAGPAIAADGTLYIATESATLYALDDAGQALWQTALVTAAVGTPALDAQGNIYVVDIDGGLSSFTPEGDARWHVLPENAGRGYTSPMAAPDGRSYYVFTRSGKLILQAIGVEGDTLWEAAFDFSTYRSPPSLSPDGDWVFWSNYILNARDGAALLLEGSEDVLQYFTGANGQVYARYRDALMPLTPSVTGFEPARQEAIWWLLGDATQVRLVGARDGGVTPDDSGWLMASPNFGRGAQVVWGRVDTEEIPDALGNVRIARIDQPHPLAVDRDATLYLCGDAREERICYALGLHSEEPLWTLTFDGDEHISGGALAPGRLYITTSQGRLYAVGGALGTAAARATTVLVGADPAWERPEVPGGHAWAMHNHDAWGTLWTESLGPQAAKVRWIYENQGGFSGAPVVAADGTLYIGAKAGALLSLSPEGAFDWSAKLIGSAVGSPALGADGTIYVTDSGGYLFAFTPEGDMLWQHHATGVVTQTQGGQEVPVPLDGLGPAGAGPMVAPDGTLYYSLGVETWQHGPDLYFRSEVMQAVTPAGQSVLAEAPFVWSERMTPRVAPGEAALFWGTMGLQSLDEYSAARPYYDYVEQVREREADEYLDIYTFAGADGRAYLTYRRTFETFSLTSQGLVVTRAFAWEPETSPGSVQTLGATPEGLVWMLFGGGKFVWIDTQDTVYGPVRFPLESLVIAVDAQHTAYGCGSSMGKAPECMAYAFDNPEPLWQLTLAEGEKILDGALAPGVAYVVTNAGRLYALGD